MDQVRLIGKAAGICDIRPAQAAFPRGDNFFVPLQWRILLGAGPVYRAKAARQVPLADTQLRGEFSYAQAGIAAQPRGSAGKSRILAILTQILKKKTFDAGDPFAAAAGLHHLFLQQGDIVILENVTQSDLDVHELMHGRPGQPGGALRLEPDGDDTKRAARTNCKDPALGLGQHMAVVFVIIAVGAELPPALRQCAVLNDEIRRGAGRHLDRKGGRRIAVRNVPIPDRLDEVGNGSGGPDAPRKAVDVLAAPPGWLQLQLRKPDRLSRYHEKSSILLQEPEKIPQAKRGASFGVMRAFKGCPWLFLVTIITVETSRHEAGRVIRRRNCASVLRRAANRRQRSRGTRRLIDLSNRDRMARHSEQNCERVC